MSEDSEPLTPYQGDRQCLGHFKCVPCNREWTSAWSWANTSQKCFLCKVPVYPYRQRMLIRRKRVAENANKGHKSELCGKCIMLGETCNVRRASAAPGRRRRRRRAGAPAAGSAPATAH